MVGHALPYVPGNSAEILSNDGRVGTPRFQAQDGVELFSGIPDIDTLIPVEAFRNPIQAV